MIFKVKNGIFIVVFLGLGWVSWKTYTYFFDTTIPEISLQGIVDNEWYGGDIQCSLQSNKKGEVGIFLDGQPLIKNYTLYGNHQEQQFSIPSKTIANGAHTLKVQFVDYTYQKNKVVIERPFQVDNVPLQAAFVRPDTDYKVFQGRTLHIQFQVNKEIKQACIKALSNNYPCFPEAKGSLVYESFIPVTCEEQANEYLFTVEMKDRVGNNLNLDNKFQVVLYPFKKQIVEIPTDKIQEAQREANESDARFNEIVENLSKSSIQEKLWKGVFCTPIDILRITCDFGTIRTTQHKGRYAHKALDVINKPKSIIWSTQDGIVVLKDRFEASGNTVIIDHGFGVLSLFYHLDTFAKINVGDKIVKGSPIGTIGKTGHATGVHLHWEMRVNNIQVDPMQWTMATF